VARSYCYPCGSRLPCTPMLGTSRHKIGLQRFDPGWGAWRTTMLLTAKFLCQSFYATANRQARTKS